MKIISKHVDRATGEGTIQLEAEEPDDMYHLYNLVIAGDEVEGSTVRNVTRETKTGSVEKSRLRMRLTIKVERVEYDSEQGTLRIAGTNVVENEHVKLGQFHTITVELNHPFKLYKLSWDTIFMSRLDEAVDPAAKADIACIVMQEGLAHVCLVTPFLTQTRARITRPMPKKRDGGDKYAKALSNFFSDIYDAVRKFIDFSIVKVVLCGSPGFLKDDFYVYLKERALGVEDSGFVKNLSKFVRAHASSGHKKAVDEMLAQPEVAAQVGDVKAAKDVQALQEFYAMMAEDEDRAMYGYDQVVFADEQLAIKSLLVTDRFFLGHGAVDASTVPTKSTDSSGAASGSLGAGDFNLRKKYVALAESVKAHGGEVFVFSSMHASGQQLDNFTGCAAILRFPLSYDDIREAEAATTQEAVAGASSFFLQQEFDDEYM